MKSAILRVVFSLVIGLNALVTLAHPFEFFADSLSGNQGTQLVVPIRANDFDSIISIQGTISFDSAVLQFVGVQNMNLPSMSSANFGTSYVANGRLTFSWNEFNLTPISVPDGSEMFGVLFQIVGQPGQASPIGIVGTPTLIEVVNWAYAPILFSTRGGNVRVNVPHVCELPDSLVAVNVTQTQAELHWLSRNPGANYHVEWGPWGFTPGNGIGTAQGTSLLGDNLVTVTNLLAGQHYEFYVEEACDSLVSVAAGPFGFATSAIQTAVTVYGDSIQGPQGTTDTLYIRTIGFVDIISAQGTLSWDPAVAVYAGVVPMLPNMTNPNFGTSQVGAGKLSFSWNDPTLIGVTNPDSSAIFGVILNYVGLPGASCPMDLVQLPTIWEVVDAGFSTAALTFGSGHLLVTPQGTGLDKEAFGEGAKVVPNPISSNSDQFELVFDGNLPQVLQVGLLNEWGQNLVLDWFLAGSGLRFQLPENANAGIWFLKVDTEQGPIVKKIVIDRL